MSDEREVLRATAARLDAFVDAAFAFAVTLLVLGGGDAPSTMAELTAVLLRAPAFAAGFALIALFWTAHREFGRLTPRRDPLSTLLSLAVVFVVLLYVFPLRMLMDGFLYFVSGTGPSGGEASLGSLSDLKALYLVYGGGFLTLSLLYVALFGHALRQGGGDPAKAEAAREWRATWSITAGAGVLSILLAFIVPLESAPSAPGFAYCAIPLTLALRGLWSKRRRPLAPGRAPPI